MVTSTWDREYVHTVEDQLGFSGGNMTDYEWLTEMGLCHKCRKERTAPGKKFCFNCLEIIREDNAKRYDPEKAKEYQNRRR